jgi:hypothetical protein
LLFGTVDSFPLLQVIHAYVALPTATVNDVGVTPPAQALRQDVGWGNGQASRHDRSWLVDRSLDPLQYDVEVERCRLHPQQELAKALQPLRDTGDA